MPSARPRLHAIPLRRSLGALLFLVAAGLTAIALNGQQRLVVGQQVPIFFDRVQAAAEKLDPNTAPLASLQRLPHIGPVRAQNIDLYRKNPANPPFRTADDLARVSGIGPGTIRTIQPYLTFPSNTP